MSHAGMERNDPGAFFSKTQDLATAIACRKLRILFQRSRRIRHGITGIIETHCRFIEAVATLFAGPDKAIQFFRRAFPFNHKGPGAFAAARRMGHISGQEKNFPGLEQCELLLPLRVDLMEIEFAFELIEDLIPGIDVKILASIRSAGYERNEIGVFPDHPALPPVAAGFVDPLPQIETGQVRKHRASFGAEKI